MKKVIFAVSIFCFIVVKLFASDIPFFKSLFMGDEEYVKQELLKCKDVESVEFERRSDYPEDDAYRISVYLTKNRFISFADIELYHFRSTTGRWPQTLLQINDLAPIVQYFKPRDFLSDYKIKYVCSFRGWVPIKFLPELTKNKELNNIINIINNIDYVYDYINSLPKVPDNTPEHMYFDGDYDKEMKIPKELENDVPFSIIEQKEYYNSTLKVLRTYEERYKFYKMSVEDAQRKYPYTNFKTDF